jgi:hypothetical protein
LQLKNKKTFVAFLDILGFKKLIDDHYSGKNVNALPLLKISLKEAEKFAIKYSKQYLKKYKIKFSFKQFSDCVSISMPLNPEHNISDSFGIFINVIRLYQLILLDNNILIRGGISVGGHFENSNIIFSDALVKSYKLESQNAIYPRILVDKELILEIEKNLINYPENSKIFYELYGDTLIKDWDDEVFISPIGIFNNIKNLNNVFDETELKNMFDDYSNVNKLGTDFTPDLIYEITENDNYEKKITKNILTFIDNYLIQNRNEKTDVLLKYKWLKQFIIWSKTPEKSKIKFSFLFINPEA